MRQVAGTGRIVSVHWLVWCLVIIRIGRNYFTAGFLVWWRIGGELIGNMVIILRLYWSVRRGYCKSTFCRIILPPELRFGYTDSIDFKSKQEAERYLGRFFLINIDEFDQINVSQQGFLKHLLQKPVANLRKPYGNTIREMRRYASFIGTSNQKDLLTDPSGSRRFICIEVTAPINTNVTINYKQLYAQAMEAIYKGERYWLNDEDENILKQTNREFEQASPLEQLFHCYLNPVEEEMEGEWLTAMQILSYLQTKTRDKLAINKVGQFGRALQKLNIPCRKSRKGTLYHLMKVE